MASSIVLLALVFSVKLSANYAHPTSGINVKEDWPEQCENRNYCWEETKAYRKLKEKKTFERLLRGETLYHKVGNETDDRYGLYDDVAGCRNKLVTFKQLTMIRDEKNVIWYIPQTANYTVIVAINECENTRILVTLNNSWLDQHALETKTVHCTERRINFKFPVLSQDQTTIESEPRSPYEGLPIYCSAKILS